MSHDFLTKLSEKLDGEEKIKDTRQPGIQYDGIRHSEW